MPDQSCDSACKLSQRTLVAMWQILAAQHDFQGEILYAHDFPEWFVAHAESYYLFDWQRILRDFAQQRGSAEFRLPETPRFLLAPEEKRRVENAPLQIRRY
jgi:hypothetical protein